MFTRKQWWSNPFHPYVAYMTCHGIVSGYADNTFRPYNTATRGQFSKMVALAYNWPGPDPGQQTFTDVPPIHPFYRFIEAAAEQGVISGYACGGPGEPCDPTPDPWFRPNNNITRAQIAKVLVLAGAFAVETTGGPHFTDVPASNPFYGFVETMANLGIISGYACGGSGERCDPQNYPYFRPGANATRGQIGKMIYLALAPR